MRCLRGLFRFDPATICLALTFVFSGTVGAVAQTAVPGPHRTVASGAMVVLYGSGSVPSAGNTITVYGWTTTDAVAGCSTAPEYEKSGSQLTFTAETLAPGAADVTYCFWLRVDQDNGDGTSFTGPVRVTVSHSVAPPPPRTNLRFQMRVRTRRLSPARRLPLTAAAQRTTGLLRIINGSMQPQVNRL